MSGPGVTAPRPARDARAARRRFAVFACLALALAFAAVGRSGAAGGFGIPGADSTFVDSLRTVYRDSLRLAAQDTSRADSLLAVAVQAVLRDSLSASGGDTTGVGRLAMKRVVLFTGADSIHIRDALGLVPEGPGFHPTIKIGVRDERDSRTMTQSVQKLTFQVGPRLSVTTGANTSQRKSKSFEQRSSSRSSNTEVKYELTPEVSIISTLQVSQNRNKAVRAAERTLTNDSFQSGTSFAKTFGDSTRVNVDLTGGTTGQKNVKFSTRGASGEAKGTMTMVPASWLHASADYQGSRARTRSKNLEQHFETNDRSASDNLITNATLSLPAKTQLALKYNRDFDRQERPDTLGSGGTGGRQETRTEENQGFSMNLDSQPFVPLRLHGESSFGDRSTDFSIQRDAYQRVRDRNMRGSVTWTLPWKMVLDAALQNQQSRSTYRKAPGEINRAGTSEFRVLNSSLKQPLGARLTLETRADVQLQTYTYDDKSYTQDRDALDQKYSVKADYRARSFLQVTTEFAVQNRKTLYMHTTKSLQNTNSDNYTLAPALTWRLAPKVTVSQSYRLDATYTEYTFDPAKNTVSRISTLNTAFNYDLTRHVGISFAHSYRDQDSGKLLRREAGEPRSYSPASRTERQELRVGVNYHPLAMITLKADERVVLDRTWTYVNGDPRFAGQDMNEYFSAEVNGRVNIRGLTMTFGAAINLGNGRQVPDNQTKYSTANLDLTYTY